MPKPPTKEEIAAAITGTAIVDVVWLEGEEPKLARLDLSEGMLLFDGDKVTLAKEPKLQ